MQFKYYVLNSDPNTKKPYMFNVFDNIYVQEYTEKAIKKYLRSPSKYKYEYSSIFQKPPIYGFDALCAEIRSIIKWQEWSRCEYEINVKDMFSDKWYKWDCAMQCEPNIEIITRECIYQYKKQLKEMKDESNN